MKREFLINLDIDQESIEKIMAEHGKTVQSLNDKIAEKETTIVDLNAKNLAYEETVKELQAGTEDDDIGEKYKNLQDKYQEDKGLLEQQLQKTKMESAINLELVKRSAYNNKTVLPLIDMELVEITDDGIKGLSEQLDAIQEKNSYLFKQEESQVASNMSVDKNPNRQRIAKKDALREALGIKGE